MSLVALSLCLCKGSVLGGFAAEESPSCASWRASGPCP